MTSHHQGESPIKDAFDSFCEHAKIPVPIFSILAFLIYLVSRDELYMELFLFIALAETGFLPAEGTEDWIVVKGMLKLCRYGFMNSTPMVGRKDEIPPELLEYIQQLLDAIRSR